jgi:NADPH:quinone reductase-like Zn-dependent oxidoreductase
MRAVEINAYGTSDVLELNTVPMPEIGPDEALVRVHYAAANPKDTFIRKGRFKLLTRNNFPIRLGSDYAGIVEKTGANITHVTSGQAVWGMVNGWRGGTHADYVAVRADEIAPAPESLSLHDAAGLPLVGLTALQSLRDKGNIQAENRVLINGASGGVGTVAVQIARHYHAQITAVCSPRNHDLVRDLGADETIDYHTTDLTTLDKRFDIFFDVFGNFNYQQIAHLLNTNGVYITTVPKPVNFWHQFRTRLWGDKSAELIVVKSNVRDLNFLAQQVDAGGLRPVIDSTYPLTEIKAVHEKLRQKRTVGKIIIDVGGENE